MTLFRNLSICWQDFLSRFYMQYGITVLGKIVNQATSILDLFGNIRTMDFDKQPEDIQNISLANRIGFKCNDPTAFPNSPSQKDRKDALPSALIVDLPAKQLVQSCICFGIYVIISFGEYRLWEIAL